MSERRIDVFTRHAARAISRRGSLMTLGGAALAAAVAGPSLIEAKKNGKNGKKANKKCKRQDGQCAAFFVDHCEEIECEPEELEAALRCCSVLRTCNAGNFLECIFDLLTGGSPT